MASFPFLAGDHPGYLDEVLVAAIFKYHRLRGFKQQFTVVPWYPWRIGFSPPSDTKIPRCSRPLREMV